MHERGRVCSGGSEAGTGKIQLKGLLSHEATLSGPPPILEGTPGTREFNYSVSGRVRADLNGAVLPTGKKERKKPDGLLAAGQNDAFPKRGPQFGDS